MSESKSINLQADAFTLPQPHVQRLHDAIAAYKTGMATYGLVQRALDAALSAERVAECERCAAIADDEARIREEAGRTHPEDSEARGRCFAAARAAVNIAKGIRGGEVVAAIRRGAQP